MKLLPLLLPLSLSAQYEISWLFPEPNEACWASYPSCEGIDNEVCAVPYSSHGFFQGAQVNHSGVIVCPDAPNARLHTKGWTQGYTSSHFVMFSATATIPLQIDSIRISYQTDPGGPGRIRVNYEDTISTGVPEVLLGDWEIPDTEIHDTTFTHFGCLLPEDQSFTGFILHIRAYEMTSSSRFFIGQVRVYASPCITLSVGSVPTGNTLDIRGRYFNLQGQEVRPHENSFTSVDGIIRSR